MSVCQVGEDGEGRREKRGWRNRREEGRWEKMGSEMGERNTLSDPSYIESKPFIQARHLRVSTLVFVLSLLFSGVSLCYSISHSLGYSIGISALYRLISCNLLP